MAHITRIPMRHRGLAARYMWWGHCWKVIDARLFVSLSTLTMPEPDPEIAYWASRPDWEDMMPEGRSA